MINDYSAAMKKTKHIVRIAHTFEIANEKIIRCKKKGERPKM
jgi:hypothetical protein